MTPVASLVERTARDNLVTLAAWVKRAEARGDRGAAARLRRLMRKWEAKEGDALAAVGRAGTVTPVAVPTEDLT